MLKHITLFDTSLVGDNIGDDIIMDSVRKELRGFFPKDFFVSVPTHDRLGPAGRKAAQNANLSFIGGSNLLCPNWLRSNQWKIGIRDYCSIGHPILMGVGWVSYGQEIVFPTGHIMKFLFNRAYYHSVRDTYTECKLNKVGINNVLNTGCPTMWNLTPEHCRLVPKIKASVALITVTGYVGGGDIDRTWIEAVCNEYKTVYFWPQMRDDEAYLRAIVGTDKIVTLPASLDAYDQFLACEDVDFIGTRLHGGIRAIQHKRRSIILQIDNRAAEISKDTGLPSVPRTDISQIQQRIKEPFETAIKMPLDRITQWRAQFKTT